MLLNKENTQDRAKDQAQVQYESIAGMIKALKEAKTDEAIDTAREAIQEDALEACRVVSYMILLCTGGPAVRIVGKLNEYSEPETAQLQYQDWGTLWINYDLPSQEADEILLEYAREYYFGE